jgi:hypothetical protein
METISKSARKEIIEALRRRYQQASKAEKGVILGEFTTITGFHRKHAIRLLNSSSQTAVEGAIENNASSQRIYDEAVKAAIVVLWEAADRICGKRLRAALEDNQMRFAPSQQLPLDLIAGIEPNSGGQRQRESHIEPGLLALRTDGLDLQGIGGLLHFFDLSFTIWLTISKLEHTLAS